MKRPSYVNVSSVNDFMVCRFRWWVRWVMNRDSVLGAPALEAGKLLHRIFERHFLGEPLIEASDAECEAFRLLIPSAHPAAQNNAMKALAQITDLREAWPLWEDRFADARTLEVEEGFEYPDPELPWLIWRGRPDRVIVYAGRVWHMQNRGLAASTNFGTYCRLALRHYHEHLYGEHLAQKYPDYKYGGTIFNLTRKLRFRTNIGKKNETVKTAAEMFYQQAVSYEVGSPLHASVMASMRQHVTAMRETERLWHEDNVIPAANEKMNGGYGGNSEDVFFKLLLGEVSLQDDSVFKAREEMYAAPETE